MKIAIVTAPFCTPAGLITGSSLDWEARYKRIPDFVANWPREYGLHFGGNIELFFWNKKLHKINLYLGLPRTLFIIYLLYEFFFFFSFFPNPVF